MGGQHFLVPLPGTNDGWYCDWSLPHFKCHVGVHRTKKYYTLDSYCLDSYCLPSLVYPDLCYDDGLFCSLVHDGSAPLEKLYPPGTRVEQIDPTTKLLVVGTVMDIPISTDVLGSPSYLILFDNGTSASIPLPDMLSMIPAPPVPMPNTALLRILTPHIPHDALGGCCAPQAHLRNKNL